VRNSKPENEVSKPDNQGPAQISQHAPHRNRNWTPQIWKSPSPHPEGARSRQGRPGGIPVLTFDPEA
jgi:hypothetical protein